MAVWSYISINQQISLDPTGWKWVSSDNWLLTNHSLGEKLVYLVKVLGHITPVMVCILIYTFAQEWCVCVCGGGGVRTTILCFLSVL